MTLPKFKKIEINRYKPGKSKILRIRKVIKLSANESALGTSKKALKVLLKKNNIFKYPDNESTNLRPIRLSFFKGGHYDSIVDDDAWALPIGLGLG